MEKLVLSKISLADLKRLTNFQRREIADYPWTQTETISLTTTEQRRLQDIVSALLHYPAHLMNEATLFARAIYPLLLLAEHSPIQACAQVTLQACYSHFELEGVADAVLAKNISGSIESPYLVVVETKRGVENQNPIYQLYGQLLAVARLHWENEGQLPLELFGCYTIADSWTLVRAEVADIDSDLPLLRVECSREYAEKTEAETILKILKGIIAKYLQRLECS